MSFLCVAIGASPNWCVRGRVAVAAGRLPYGTLVCLSACCLKGLTTDDVDLLGQTMAPRVAPIATRMAVQRWHCPRVDILLRYSCLHVSQKLTSRELRMPG